MRVDVTVAGRMLTLVEGDITEMQTDAIVNAANAQLVLGGGVAGAIRRKGGPQIQAECDRIGGTFVGGAVITTGGTLKARHVIHAVGPRMGEGDEDAKLKNATLNALKVADEHRLRSIAFPALSTGIFGFPMPRCAEIMLSAAVDHLQGGTQLEHIVFCLYGSDSYRVFAKELSKEVGHESHHSAPDSPGRRQTSAGG
jgi:O-acetyl-ADP-ribose deacetylase (regulator of RNase III)